MGFDVMDFFESDRAKCVNCKRLIVENKKLSDKIKRMEIEMQQLRTAIRKNKRLRQQVSSVLEIRSKRK